MATGLPALPAELVLHILSYLEPVELAIIARTCRTLQGHSYDDSIWQPFINCHSVVPVTEPYPLDSFRELFVAHHPYWFLPKHRIWFADGPPSGKLLISRFEPATGSIAAYTVTATRRRQAFLQWDWDRNVIIHGFDPEISLHLGRPEVNLEVDGPHNSTSANDQDSDDNVNQKSRYSTEKLMNTSSEAGLYASFMLCRTLPESAISEATQVWPPLRFPAKTRTRSQSSDEFNSLGHWPNGLSQVSQNNFRIRKWVEYTGRTRSPRLVPFTSTNGLATIERIRQSIALRFGNNPGGGISIRMPEDIMTYATLPESCYTPSAKKPWQGIWCGDYSAHGCEFLLIQQPNKEDERPLPAGFPDFLGGPGVSGEARQDSWSSSSSYGSTLDEAQTHSTTVSQSTTPRDSNRTAENQETPEGRLEAIKLTGDPNIPRGEYTFIAPDIGPRGFIRTADEQIFQGARVVRSAGHVALPNFVHDQWITSQLLLVSYDTLAQFWEYPMGHISYYKRVDLDALLNTTAPAESETSSTS